MYMVMYDMLRANKANKDKPLSQKNYVQVKEKNLAYKMGISERQCRRILAELKENKLILADRWGNETTMYYLADL